jgi:phosphatidylglycerol:prolipoprotein diacylglycerol transferase
MVFRHVDQLPRHPSQLYEVALEGIVLFTFLWWFSSKPRPRMAVTGLFAIGYGSFRFFIEFFREPDLHLGFVALDWMTMGQVLSAPLIVAGLILLVLAYMKPQLQLNSL